MKNNISFVIGLKNNIEYTKYFHENTRKYNPNIEIIYISYGSNDGTHEWLDSLDDKNTIYYYSDKIKTLSDTYNKGISLARKEYVCFLHNDMVLGLNFVDNLSNNLSKNKINMYSVVEPPIYVDDKRDWKILSNFPDTKENLLLEDFYNFEKNFIENLSEIIIDTHDNSFFICVDRNILIEIGGLDSLFCPMFCEDDDLILRLKLYGLQSKVIKNAILYHFISKTSRFSEEFANNTKRMEVNSQRNFIRKWRFKNNSITKIKYDIGLILKNYTNIEDIIYKLEPYFENIYTDWDYSKYIEDEQKNTKIDIKNKFKNLKNLKNNDVLVEIDCKYINEKTFDFVYNISTNIKKMIDVKKIEINLLKKTFYSILKPYRPIVEIVNIETHELNNIIRKEHDKKNIE